LSGLTGGRQAVRRWAAGVGLRVSSRRPQGPLWFGKPFAFQEESAPLLIGGDLMDAPRGWKTPTVQIDRLCYQHDRRQQQWVAVLYREEPI
jgi:hypothetical protein